MIELGRGMMNSTFFSRLGSLRGKRAVLAGAVCGVVVAVLAAGLLVATGRSADDDEMRGARAISVNPAMPGFAGALPDSAEPVGDAAPGIAMAPLAGVAAIATATRPVHALLDHPLFAQHIGIGRVDCALPDWRDDPESARAFYRAGIACLDAAWRPTLRGAGLPFRSPRLLAPAKAREVGGRCAQVKAEPVLYCGADETVVLPYDTLAPLISGSRRGAQLTALTTAYGRHVQALIGVMKAYTDKRTGLGWGSAAGQEQSRRLWLQARCFSGMFLGTNVGRGDIDQDTWNEASRFVRGDDSGDRSLRGSDENAWGWWRWGSDKGDTWECNTWYSVPANVE